ncbi:restriction endonuclease subunit S [Microcoleus sp. T3B2]|uniref:restriction endonuclease subunit S n=1 Tax=Microcoleus sp. T3B2 TaxID=3055426 RepID=UPI002FCFC61C
MKPYPKYKDSGVEWLGEIPEHWQVKRLKSLARIKNGQDYKLVHTDEPIYPVIGSGGQFAYASQYLFKGESVLLGRKGTVDKPLYVNCAFWTVDTMFYTEINNNTFPKFLYYSALTIPFAYLLTNTTVPSMTQDDLGNHLFAFAPLEEQKAIAHFIDRKLEQIEQFIRNKKRLIELLNEQKTAIINRAVTKGINPNAPMKDSGIGWLGEIPAHWEVVKLKFLAKRITDGEHISPKLVSEGILLLSAKDIRDKEILYDVDKFVSIEDAKQFWLRCKPKMGDVLIVSRGATIGRVAIVEDEIHFCLMGSVILCRLKSEVVSLFIYFALNSNYAQKLLFFSSAASAQPAIYITDIAELAIPIPTLQEQNQIIDYLESESKKINIAIAQIEKEIELIQEYRTTLISDAVTGKIDVRPNSLIETTLTA